MTTEAPAKIERFESSTSVRVYRIPMEVFQHFVGYAYLLLGAGVPTLVDTGSGFGSSTQDLLRGIEAVRGILGRAELDPSVREYLQMALSEVGADATPSAPEAGRRERCYERL